VGYRDQRGWARIRFRPPFSGAEIGRAVASRACLVETQLNGYLDPSSTGGLELLVLPQGLGDVA
jgi:hypothetical protein